MTRRIIGGVTTLTLTTVLFLGTVLLAAAQQLQCNTDVEFAPYDPLFGNITCTGLLDCSRTFCTCSAGNFSNSSCRLPASNVATCPLRGGCIAAYIDCVQAAAPNCVNPVIAWPDRLYNFENGDRDVRYADSDIGLACYAGVCRLANNCSVDTNSLCDTLYTTGTGFYIFFGGTVWSTIALNKSSVAVMKAAFAADLRAVFQEPTEIESIEFDIQTQQANARVFVQDVAILDLITLVQRNGSAWLTNTSLNAWRSIGQAVNTLVVASESLVQPPISDFTQVKCDASCIAGVVVASVAFLGVIGVIIICFVRMKRDHEFQEEPDKLPTMMSKYLYLQRSKLAQQGILIESIVTIMQAGRAVAARDDGTTYKVLRAMTSAAVTDFEEHQHRHEIIRPSDQGATPMTDIVAEELLSQMNECEIHSDRVERCDVLVRSYVRACRSLKNLYQGDLLTEARKCVRDVTVATPLTLSEDVLFCLACSLYQPLHGQRYHRLCCLSFSHLQAEAFTSKLNQLWFAQCVAETREMHPDDDIPVDRAMFNSAYKQATGQDTPMVLQLKLYPHIQVKIPLSVIAPNLCSAAHERMQSFPASATIELVTRSRYMMHAMRFVPFLALLVTYILIEFGLEEAYFTSRATVQYVEEAPWPVLDDTFPNCDQCAFYQRFFKGFFDIANPGDIQDFLNGVGVRTFFPKTDTPAATPYRGNNFRVGALKIRQVRVEGHDDVKQYNSYFGSDRNITADENATLETWFDRRPGGYMGRRYPSMSMGRISRDSYSVGADANFTDVGVKQAFMWRSARDLNGSDTFRGLIESEYPADGFALVLPVNLTNEEGRRRMRAVLDAGWVDAGTRFILLEYFVFNRDTRSLVRNQFAIEVTSSGSYHSTYQTLVFTMFETGALTAAYWVFYVCLTAAIFLYMIPYALVTFVYTVPRQQNKLRNHSGVFYHLRGILFYSCTDSFTLLYMMNAVCLLITWIYRFWWFVNTLTDNADALIQVEYFPPNLDALASRAATLIYLHTACICAAFLLLIRFLSLDSSFSVISRTLLRASNTLISLVIILFTFIVAFGLCAHIVFGSVMREYETMPKAMGNTLLTMVGNYDYDAWKLARQTYTPVYFTFFMIVVVLLILNMVIAVLTGNFEEVMNETFDPLPHLTLFLNDPTVTVSPPSFADHVRSSVFLNGASRLPKYLFIYTKHLLQTFERKVLKRTDEEMYVAPWFDLDRGLSRLYNSDRFHFWKGINRAVEFAQSGSPVEALASFTHFCYLRAPMCEGGYDTLIATGGDQPDIPRIVGSARSKTLRSALEAEYTPRRLPLVMMLFQEMPCFHLDVSSSILVLQLFELRHSWRREVDSVLMEVSDGLTLSDAYEQLQDLDLKLRSNALSLSAKREGLIHVEFKEFSNGGFDPLISDVKRQSMMEWCRVEAKRVQANGVPLATFVRRWNELGIGREFCEQEEESSVEESMVDESVFHTIAVPVTLPGGGIESYVAVESVSKMLSNGVEAFESRQRRFMSLNWSTKDVRRFSKVAGLRSSKSRSEQPSGTGTANLSDVICETDLAEDGNFTKGWRAVYFDMHAIPDITVRRSVIGVTYDRFLSTSIKNPGAHAQCNVFSLFAITMLQRSADMYHFGWYLIFLVLFVYFTLSGRGTMEGAEATKTIYDMFVGEQTVYPEVNKNDNTFEGSTNFAMWRNALMDITIPTIFSAVDGRGTQRMLDLAITPTGAIKVRQVRTGKTDCNDLLAGLTGTIGRYAPTVNSSSLSAFDAFYYDRTRTYFEPLCVEAYSSIAVSGGAVNSSKFPANVSDRIKAAFETRGCDQLRGAGRMTTAYSEILCRGHTIKLGINTTKDDALNDLNILWNNGWVDDQTQALLFEATFYNYNVNLFSRLTEVVETMRTGETTPAWEVVNFVPFQASAYTTAYIGFMFIFFLTIILQLYLWGVNLWRAFRRFRNMPTHLALMNALTSDIWWFLGIGSLALFVAAWIWRGMLMIRGTSKISLWKTDDVLENIENIADDYKTLDGLDGLCAVVTFARAMYFFRVIPSLNLFNRTIVIAASNITSLLVVFFVCFFCFTITGNLVFGPSFRDFATFDFTMSTLFRVLVGNDIDYTTLSQFHPVFGGIYYAAFLIMCLFILFNLIVGVLTNAFEAASEEQFDMQPLDSAMQYDASSKTKLQGARSPIFLVAQVAVNEAKLVFHIVLFVVTYPISDHVEREKRKAKFLLNPRYFWQEIVACHESANPMLRWHQLLTRLDCLTISVPLLEDLRVTTPLFPVEGANNDVAELVGEPDIFQTFSKNLPRVNRLEDVLVQTLGALAEDSVFIAAVASKVTGINMAFFIKNLIEFINDYERQSSAFDNTKSYDALRALWNVVVESAQTFDAEFSSRPNDRTASGIDVAAFVPMGVRNAVSEAADDVAHSAEAAATAAAAAFSNVVSRRR